jgi:poly-beta-1,6-N-acetyl-D-glucosamine N-deacetylase
LFLGETMGFTHKAIARRGFWLRDRCWFRAIIWMAFSFTPILAWTAQAQTGVDITLSRAVILSYSRVGDDSGATGSSISVENFEAHLAELRSGEFTVLPVPEIIAALRANRPLPDRTVGILFDESHSSVYTQAWPRLRAARLPATLFVATDTVDRAGPDTLSWSEIRDMAGEGLELGNQTASYPHLLGIERAYFLGQIARAADRIRKETGRKPRLFAYPYGEHDAPTRALVAAEGYEAAFAQQSGVAHARLDPYALPRFAMNDPFASVERLRLAMQALPLLVSDITPTDMALESTTPAIGFTLDPMMGGTAAQNLACFVSGIGRADVQELGERRVEVRLREALPSGRSRLNCTLPAGDGRWRWFGLQLVAP